MRAVFAVLLSFMMLAVNGSFCSPGDSHHPYVGNAMAGPAVAGAQMADMAQHGSCDPLSGICDLAGQAASHDPVAVTASAPTTQPFISGHQESAQWTDLHLQTGAAVPSLPVKAATISFSTPVSRHTVLRV